MAEPVKFKLDLDVVEFGEKAMHAKGLIESLGDAESMEGLISGLGKASLALGTVGLAVFSFKKALDFTLEAEGIKRVEAQFGMLAQAAGVSAAAIKKGLDEQSKGLLDNTDLMEIANKAMVGLGDSSAKLPEILELSRKATQVFGGDLKNNFDQIAQAVSMGNTRLLKHYGILVDSEQALKKYADAQGVAVNELSEAGKRQAILNEALIQGQKAFKDVNEDMESATTNVQLLSTTFGQLKEIVILTFEKVMGPAVRATLNVIKDVAAETKTWLTSTFGEGLEKNEAQLERTKAKLMQLKGSLIDLETGQGLWDRIMPDSVKAHKILVLNQEIKKTTEELEKLEAANHQMVTSEEQKEAQLKKIRQESGVDPKADKINKDAIQANEVKFQQAMLKIKTDVYAQEKFLINNVKDVDGLAKKQMLFLEEQHALRIKQINADTALDKNKKGALVAAENRKHQLDMQAEEKKTAKLRSELLAQYRDNATNAFEGVGRAFQASAYQAQADMHNFGKTGQEVMQSFSSHSTAAFEQMGASVAQGGNIAEATATAIKSIFLNMIADRAIASGSLMLLEGFINPVLFAPGAALIALGGALKAVAGSIGAGGGSVPTASPISAGTPTTSTGRSTARDDEDTRRRPSEPAVTEARELGASGPSAAVQESQITKGPDMAKMASKSQRVVNVNIAGNVLNTESTRRELMELIRRESDATDFKYASIGV